MKIKTNLWRASILALAMLFLCSAATAQEETPTAPQTHPLWDVSGYIYEGADNASEDYGAFLDYMEKHPRAWPEHMRFYLVDTSMLVLEEEGEEYDPSLMRLDVDGQLYEMPQYCPEAYPVAEYRDGGMKRALETYYLEHNKKALLAVSSFDGSPRYLVQNIESSESAEEWDERFAITFYDKDITIRTVEDEWEMRCAIDILALENFVPVEYGNVYKLTHWWNNHPGYWVRIGNQRGEKYSGPITVLY